MRSDPVLGPSESRLIDNISHLSGLSYQDSSNHIKDKAKNGTARSRLTCVGDRAISQHIKNLAQRGYTSLAA